MLPRHVAPRLLDALSDTPVVMIAGARQVGKSTLAKQVLDRLGGSYITLDDATALAAASSDPAGFVRGLPRHVVIDEVQRVPELLLAVKASVDEDREPGRFLLTGSADVLTLPKVADSLAGRMEIVQLWPFSQGELAGRREDFVATAFADAPLEATPEGAESDPVARLLAGGYPEAVARKRRERRTAWFDAYVTTILQRDVQDLANIDGLREMPQLLRLLAARTSTLLNVASLAREIGFPQTTLRRYLDLVEAIFLLHRQPAWTSNLGKRVTRSPKLFVQDTGLAAALLDLDGERLRSDRKLFGQLLESFVALELSKQLGWSRVRARLHHFRPYNDREVDMVLERPSGRVVGIEVKAAASIDRKSFRGLETLAEAAGERFHRGFVLYLGDSVVPFGENLWALPISALWAPV